MDSRQHYIAPQYTPIDEKDPATTAIGHSPSQYTFFLHRGTMDQPEVSSQDGTPMVDRYAHARTKRKRTSPEDFAILEAEYLRNERPDKAARNEIVQRVDMTEKEVQIWFQNRRQMTRRKNRTWRPNEVTNIIRSSSQDNAPSSNEDSRDSLGGEMSPTGSQNTRDEIMQSSPSRTLAGDAVAPVAGIKEEVSLPSEPSKIPNVDVADQVEAEAVLPQLREDVTGQDLETSESLPRFTSSLPFETHATQESLSSITHSQPILDSQRSLTEGMSAIQTFRPRSPLRRVPSMVKLALSSEGQAKVVLDGSPSPDAKKSMPPLSHLRTGGLQRSQSAASLNSSLSSELPPPRRAGVFGRSRDARTWEFYCDTESRDALTIAAEHEQKGSAVAAISLIRSNSGASKKAALTPTSKHNASQLNRRDSGKRKATDEGRMGSTKPKLARTNSSMARMQSYTNEDKKNADSPGGFWKDPSGDSDKENYAPDGQPRHRSHTNTNTSKTAFDTPRGVLRENASLPSAANSLGALMDREARDKQSRRRRQHNSSLIVEEAESFRTEIIDDDEVEAFMGAKEEGGRAREVNVKEKDELDAVQNLLSLASGEWGR